MFKSGLWKSDKKKVKAVFKLQFQATQVPKSKKSTLTISLVPEDVGKPTVKLEKAEVQDGTCSWENPVYETVKLIRESKTGKIREKLYHFVVSAGSSKSGFLGEASIDFADFSEETEPYTLSLPLKFANSGAILHVTIQKVQDTDGREIEENGGPPLAYREECLKNQLSILSADSTEENSQHFNLEDELLDESMSQIPPYFQQNDGEFEAKNGSIHKEPPLRQYSIHPGRLAGAMAASNNRHRRSNTEWSLGSGTDGSLEEQSRREALDATVEKMKGEIDSFTRQSTLSEMELQSLRKQIVKETKKGQSLSVQIASLMEERDAIRMECEQLRLSRIRTEEPGSPSKLQVGREETKAQLQAIRQELDHEKDVNADLQLQLQKTQDSNSKLILAVRDLDEMLKEKDTEISHLSSKIQSYEETKESSTWPGHSQKHHNAEEVDLLKRKIGEQHEDIEFYRKQKEELEMNLEQLTLEYEILKQENHDITTELEARNMQDEMNEQVESSKSLACIKELEEQIEKLESVVKRQAEELSESLTSINELRSQVKGLEKEIDKQAQEFEEDLEAMAQAKIELEQRAIKAEEALKRTKWKNAVAAERLQEEFRRLSVEMTSKFDENERQATKAAAEVKELRHKNEILEETLQKANEELRLINDSNELKVRELSTQLDLQEAEIEHMQMELSEKSKQAEDAQNDQDQNHEAFSKEIEVLKCEINRLRKEKDEIEEREEEKAKQRGGEQAEIETLVQRWNEEREHLQRGLTSARNDAEEVLKKLSNERSLKEEKEKTIARMQSKVLGLTVQQQDLKQSLQKEETKNESLKKQVLELQRELKKRNDNDTACNYRSIPHPCIPGTVASLKEKLDSLKDQLELTDLEAESLPLGLMNVKNLRSIIAGLYTSIEKLEDVRHIDTGGGSPCESGQQNGTVHEFQKVHMSPLVPSEDDMGTLERRTKTRSTKDNNDGSHTELEILRQRNKSMERELKEMQERYTELSLRFAEVEGERQQLVMAVRNLKNSKRT